MPASKKPRYTGAIDLSAPVSAAPVRKDTGVDLSQFTSVLQQSWGKKQANDPQPGFAFTFESAAIDTVKSRFRQAARSINLGVAFETGKEDANGNVRLIVEARQKKQTTKKETAPAGLPSPQSQTPPAAPAKQSRKAS